MLDIADEGTLSPMSAFADAVALAFVYCAGMIAEKALQAAVSKNRMADAQILRDTRANRGANWDTAKFQTETLPIGAA